MPDEDFYRRLTLPEKLERFLEHHSSEAVRHISAAEVQILTDAIYRLKQPERRSPAPET